MLPEIAAHANESPAPRPMEVQPSSAVWSPVTLGLATAARWHWPEYLMEAAELGLFMISACVVVAILEHPASPLYQQLPNAVGRRVLTGVAMGLTAIALIYSPWGKQSGAHFNPSVTLTFWRLGKVTPRDAVLYVVAQFAGAVAGVLIARVLLGGILAHPTVNYVATLPGAGGWRPAFLGEVFIAFCLMSVVLVASNTPRLARYTGILCGILVATYISVEAPLSGMSMNPARSFGPALVAQLWADLWVYFTAPPLGMLLAAELYVRLAGPRVACAKLHHQNEKRCIFCGEQWSVVSGSPITDHRSPTTDKESLSCPTTLTTT